VGERAEHERFEVRRVADVIAPHDEEHEREREREIVWQHHAREASLEEPAETASERPIAGFRGRQRQ